MRIHEFGDQNKPLILLLPGTMCYWKGNFGGVIDLLAKNFRVGVVSYTGFDDDDTENFCSILDEVQRIEDDVISHYDGKVCAVYGSSLGGSLVGHLVHRNRIHVRYAIIGSSDLDHAGKVKAELLGNIILKVTYHFIHTGSYQTRLMQKRYASQMASEDPYNKAFVAMVGRDRYDMSFITKESIHNQFVSDLTTELPEQIGNGETQIHVFYAKKMGEKYLDRYHKYFRNPIIHTSDLRHEELLGVYPEKWCALVNEICNGADEVRILEKTL